MKQTFIRGLHNLTERHRGCVLTIGSFDGVHLGHQAILRQVKARAAELGLASAVLIFEPQPHEYFSGEQAPARLMRLREKVLALFAEGVDRVLCLPFNARLRNLSADDFVQQVLVRGLAVQHLVVGDDFRFGCDRSGDYAYLQAAGRRLGFSVTDTPTFLVAGERVSSTRVREALAGADFALAEQLLGRPYRITGRVVAGLQLGRTLGVPTANVRLQRYRAPLSGVFAVRVQLADRCYPAVANVGVRPTVLAQAKPLLEVHLLDFAGDLYRQRLAVEFLCKLREEAKFDSLAALTAQIQRDIADARAFFASHESTTE